MKLIIGLGNPAPQYQQTRHNLGFWYIDGFAAQYDLSWQEKPKFQAYIAEGSLGGKKVILAKPITYYNLVGTSAQAICQFYKIATEDILVIHDELALPLGTVRTRIDGSDGGNNGMKSIITCVGQNVRRIRVGIDTPQRRTLGDMNDANYVLSKLSTAEIALLSELRPGLDDLVSSFIDGNFMVTTLMSKDTRY